MELKINRKELQNALQKVSGIVQKNVIIEATEKTKLSTSNQNSCIEVSCESEISKIGKVCVEFQRLFNLAKNYSGESLEFKTTKAGWLNITGQNIKLRIPGVSDYPPVSFIPLKNTLKIDFRTGIDLAHHATIENASRACFGGIYIVSENGRLTFTGADSFCFSRYYSKSESDTKLLMLKQTALEIEKLIDESTILYYDDSRIQLESDSVKFRSSLMQDHYPNIDILIDTEKKNVVSVDREGLNGLINIFTDIAAAEKDPVVKFIFKKGKISVESKKLDTGDGDGEIECNYQGDDVSIGINLQVLKKSMTAINQTKDEKLNFHFDNPESSIILTTESLQNYKAGLMPVRLQW